MHSNTKELLISKVLLKALRQAKPGNQLYPRNAKHFLVLFVLILYSNWALFAFLACLYMMLCLAVRGKIVSSPNNRKLFCLMYYTDIHLPWWADCIGYTLLFFTAIHVNAPYIVYLLVPFMLLDVLSRIASRWYKFVLEPKSHVESP